jgi:hypothetical protein
MALLERAACPTPPPPLPQAAIFSRDGVTGFRSVIEFTEFLRLLTTSKDYALTLLHTLQITTGHTKCSQSVTVFTSRCLIAASYGATSPSSGFSNCPRPQLLASHNNSSQ